MERSFDLEAARALPAAIRFGTSSWNYPGWQGLVYKNEYRTKTEFSRNCFEEYVTFPWFRTVGLDSSFYAPPSEEVLTRYARTAPDGFEWVSKVWEEVTIPSYARHKRYGTRAGKPNPSFLDPAVFTGKFLPAFLIASIRKHVGPFVFQFQEMKISVDEFLTRLDLFLQEIPSGLRYAVELRNPEFLTRKYFSLLNKYAVSHCFNHWTKMPSLKDQMRAAASVGGLSADFYIARILTPRGVRYEDAVERFQPYDRIQNTMPDMRRDVQSMMRRAIERNVTLFVLVNNRAEGCAPLTIDAIGSAFVRESSH